MSTPSDREQQVRVLYGSFNQRDWPAVAKHLDANVKWANGMEGGHVFGLQQVLEYWARQFESLSSTVTPAAVDLPDDSTALVRVHQMVRQAGTDAVMFDGEVWHKFTFGDDGKIVLFDIVDGP